MAFGNLCCWSSKTGTDKKDPALGDRDSCRSTASAAHVFTVTKAALTMGVFDNWKVKDSLAVELNVDAKGYNGSQSRRRGYPQ